MSSSSGGDAPALPRVLIIGGGFAGVTLAQGVERLLPASTQVVVISDRNHLVFTPMLPEVAGRTVPPMDTAVPGRQLTKRTRWIEGRVEAVRRRERIVYYRGLDGGESTLSYSNLVLACGAAAAADPPARTHALTVAVIGGGFSGVEIAGHVASLLRAIHPSYPELRDTHPQVTLLHAGAHLIPELHDVSLSSYTLKTLRRHGVEVHLRTNALWAIGDCAMVPNAHGGEPSPATAQFAVEQARQLARNMARDARGVPAARATREHRRAQGRGDGLWTQAFRVHRMAAMARDLSRQVADLAATSRRCTRLGRIRSVCSERRAVARPRRPPRSP